MLRSVTDVVVRAGTEHDRNLQLPAGHVTQFGGLIDDLVRRQVHKARNSQIDNGPQPRQGGPDSHPGKAILRNRDIPQPLFVKVSKSAAQP